MTSLRRLRTRQRRLNLKHSPRTDELVSNHKRRACMINCTPAFFPGSEIYMCFGKSVFSGFPVVNLLLVPEHELIIAGIHHDGMGGIHFAGKRFLGEVVEDEALYHSFHRPCTELGIIACV